MSKQSRAKSRRHKKGTGHAPTFEQSIRYMPEDRLWRMLDSIKDELHKALCDRRTFKDSGYLSLFADHRWVDLEHKVAMKNSNSTSRMKALDLIPKVRVIYDRFNGKEVK